MRICFLTSEYALEPPFGGIATYTRDAAQWLSNHGHRVHVVLPSRTDPYNTTDDQGVQFHRVPPGRIRPRRLLRIASRAPGLAFLYEAYAAWDLVENSRGAWRATRSIDQDESLDLIEVADYSGLGFWGLVRARRPAPILVRGHGILTLALPEQRAHLGAAFQHALERFTARHADFVLTNSRYMAETYREVFGVPGSQVGVHSLPFSDPPHRAIEYDVRQATGWAEDDPIVLFVGRLEKRKGIDILLKALIEAHRQAPALKAVLLGELTDCPRSLYEEFMARAGDWVYHPGAVDSSVVRSIMLQSNLLVLPSRSEPLGRVLIEAELTGLPVVGTRVGGIPEALVAGRTGLLVDPEDVDGVSEAIICLLQRPELRAEMGREALRWASEQFDVSSVMSKQVEVYRALQEGRSPLEVLEQEVC